MWLKGITVALKVRRETGKDAFNAPVYDDSWQDVDNVLVTPSTPTEITDTLNLYGKKSVYTLCIPKGDNHKWYDTEVTFFGQTFHTIGYPAEYIESLIPLEWNKKVQVERIG